MGLQIAAHPVSSDQSAEEAMQGARFWENSCMLSEIDPDPSDSDQLIANACCTPLTAGSSVQRCLPSRCCWH